MLKGAVVNVLRPFFYEVADNMTLEGRIQKYLNWKATYTQKAASTYAVHLKRFSQFVNNKRIEEVSIFDISSFLDDQKKKYSLSNVAFTATILKNFFEFWLRQGNRVVDPWLIKVPKHEDKPHLTITKSEHEKLISVLNPDIFPDLKRLVMLRLLWDTGVRVSELCDLNLCDLGKEPCAKIITKKSRKARYIFWSSETHFLLKKYAEQRIKYNRSPYLFVGFCGTTPRMNRLTTRSFQRILQGICKKAGIERKISPHSYRHAKAHRIISLGGTVKDVQAILGHSDKNPAASFSYLKFNLREIRKRAKMFL